MMNTSLTSSSRTSGRVSFIRSRAAERKKKLVIQYGGEGNARRGITLAGEEAVNVEDMQNSFDAKAWQENETDKSEFGK